VGWDSSWLRLSGDRHQHLALARGRPACVCWSHVRRNFYELATPGPSPIASEALEHIAVLYAVEKDTGIEL
jgi:hypothetical protein